MKRLLIANRGEIAVRVIRTAREMGIATVAVYSEADEGAMHVELADEAVPIGPSEPTSSYLNIGAILDAARSMGADAIHPGYGFLSERPEFAEACEGAGIVFVGPSARAMRVLGSKSDAKRLAVENDVPIVPGSFEAGADRETLRTAASSIGYPVMLKASAGGGGRGMRIVRSEEDFDRFHALAREEAEKAFGDGSMMLEKLIERPRHIEVQAIADRQGNVACLFERECSVQRRHQKLIEEAPTPLSGFAEPPRSATSASWENLRRSAETLLRAAGYVGAGTVEFIVDEREGTFAFLEVNARLQVEHPVTEAITGVDLVRWQLTVADGQSLPDREFGRTQIHGHAIEVRVVAEDPSAGFLPSVGKLIGWAEPRGPGIRVDTGYRRGSEVSRFYDSLLAKLIVHAETRFEAIRKLKSALCDFHVLGVKTNLAYMLDVLSHPDFETGDLDTDFLDRNFPHWAEGPAPPELGAILQASKQSLEPSAPPEGAWAMPDGFRNARPGPIA